MHLALRILRSHEAPAATLLGKAVPQDGAAALRQERVLRRQFGEHGTRKKLKRRRSGERIARQGDAERAARVARRRKRIADRRRSGLHQNAPEKTLGIKFLDDVVHDVLLAHGNAARRQNEIGQLGRTHERTRNLLRIVGQRTEDFCLEAHLLKSCREQVEIAVVDLAGAERLARLDKLVARARQNDAHAAHARKTLPPLPCQDGDVRRRQTIARLGEHGAFFHILPTKAEVLVMLERIRHENFLALHAHVFLPHDGVRALGHRRARHQTKRLARAHLAGEEAARTLLADDAKARGSVRRRPLRTGSQERIAVERRAVKRRLVEVGAAVLGEPSPERREKRHGLGFRQRNLAHLAQKKLLRLFQ